MITNLPADIILIIVSMLKARDIVTIKMASKLLSGIIDKIFSTSNIALPMVRRELNNLFLTQYDFSKFDSEASTVTVNFLKLYYAISIYKYVFKNENRCKKLQAILEPYLFSFPEAQFLFAQLLTNNQSIYYIDWNEVCPLSDNLVKARNIINRFQLIFPDDDFLTMTSAYFMATKKKHLDIVQSLFKKYGLSESIFSSTNQSRKMLLTISPNLDTLFKHCLKYQCLSDLQAIDFIFNPYILIFLCAPPVLRLYDIYKESLIREVMNLDYDLVGGEELTSKKRKLRMLSRISFDFINNDHHNKISSSVRLVDYHNEYILSQNKHIEIDDEFNSLRKSVHLLEIVRVFEIKGKIKPQENYNLLRKGRLDLPHSLEICQNDYNFAAFSNVIKKFKYLQKLPKLILRQITSNGQDRLDEGALRFASKYFMADTITPALFKLYAKIYTECTRPAEVVDLISKKITKETEVSYYLKNVINNVTPLNWIVHEYHKKWFVTLEPNEVAWFIETNAFHLIKNVEDPTQLRALVSLYSNEPKEDVEKLVKNMLNHINSMIDSIMREEERNQSTPMQGVSSAHFFKRKIGMISRGEDDKESDELNSIKKPK